MTLQDIYNDPVVFRLRKGDTSDPFILITQTDIVRYNTILLRELPDDFQGITVSDGTNDLSIKNSGIPDSTSVVVDWANGILSFHDTNNGKTFTISYYGRGTAYFPVNKIYTQTDTNGNIVETLKQLLDDIKSASGQVQDMRIGDMTTLQTTNNLKVVDAINEIKIKISDTAPTDYSVFWLDTSVL